jgi:hypothetical protein
MRLADYSSSDRCFELDPHTGAYSHLKLPTTRNSRAGYSGIGQILRSPREGKVLVATYLLGGDPWVAIGAEHWKRFDASLTVKHRQTWGPFVCELSLHRGNTCVRKLRYVRRDWVATIIDPAYDHIDFSLANLPVDLVPHGFSSLAKQRADFIQMWSGGAR